MKLTLTRKFYPPQAVRKQHWARPQCAEGVTHDRIFPRAPTGPSSWQGSAGCGTGAGSNEPLRHQGQPGKTLARGRRRLETSANGRTANSTLSGCCRCNVPGTRTQHSFINAPGRESTLRIPSASLPISVPKKHQAFCPNRRARGRRNQIRIPAEVRGRKRVQ